MKTNITYINSHKQEKTYFNNPSFSKNYQLMQNMIVDKSFIVDEISKRIRTLSKLEINVLDVGIGDGEIITRVINDNPRVKFNVIGIDLAENMTNNISKNISSNNCSFIIYNGINLVDRQTTVLQNLQTSFDIILSIQFDHYFPNNEQSTLYKRLLRHYSPHTKKSFAELIITLMIGGGIYYLFDDKHGETEDENITITNNWDVYVYNRIISNDSQNPSIKKIVARYKSKDISFLRRVRTKRRFDSLEEIDKLSNIYKNIKKNIKKNSLSVDIIYHPHKLLTNFFLIKIERCSNQLLSVKPQKKS